MDNNPVKPKKTWNNVEPEVLVKVLAHAYSPTKPKVMASRRLVCKHWQEVIDEHFEYWLSLNDTKFDVSTVSHLLVKNCTVVSLLKELDPQQTIFGRPKSLEKLFIWGEIHANNFYLLLKQALNLKHLSMNWKALQVAGPVAQPEPEQRERFQELWDGLDALEIAFDNVTSASLLIENTCKILTNSMQSLSTLKIRCGFPEPDWERFITTLYSFLNRSSNRNLKTLHFNWHFVRVTMPPSLEPPPFLGEIQLDSLRLLLIDDLVPFWIPLFQAQRNLKDFRLTFHYQHRERTDCTRLREVLESTLPLNRSTLQTLELSKFFSTEFNANIFKDMEKLTRLVLRPSQLRGDYQKLLNMSLLPNSIETLVLGMVSVDSQEFRVLIDRLENIKVLELMGTQAGDHFALKEIFEILTRKEKMRRITVDPLDKRIPLVEKNGKEFLVVNGYEMEVFTKRYYSINFSFP